MLLNIYLGFWLWWVANPPVALSHYMTLSTTQEKAIGTYEHVETN